MLYPIENREILEKLNELVLLQSQVKAVRLQDKLGQQNSHEDKKKIFEPLTDTIKNTSKKTKTISETSVKNNQALENLNNRLLEMMNDRNILASSLISPLSKNTKPENSTQFKLVKDSNSNRLNEFLIRN